MQKLYKRTALITGATGGLGTAIARRFAEEGARLILVGRSIQALEELDDQLAIYQAETTLVPLDLRDFSKIESLGLSLAQKFSALDIFVGNAAILGQLSPLTHQSPHLWKDVLDVNFNANFHLLRVLDPLLRRSPTPRVIFVTSGVGPKHSPYWGAYAVSKSALETMALIYAAENEKTPLRVNIVDPGSLRTRLFHQAKPGVDLETVPPPESVTEQFVYLASEDCQETGLIIQVHRT